LLKEHVVPVLALALKYFPPGKTPVAEFVKDAELLKAAQAFEIPKELQDLIGETPTEDSLKYVLHTDVRSLFF
jgi:hypothetical protein